MYPDKCHFTVQHITMWHYVTLVPIATSLPFHWFFSCHFPISLYHFNSPFPSPNLFFPITSAMTHTLLDLLSAHIMVNFKDHLLPTTHHPDRERERKKNSPEKATINLSSSPKFKKKKFSCPTPIPHFHLRLVVPLHHLRWEILQT